MDDVGQSVRRALEQLAIAVATGKSPDHLSETQQELMIEIHGPAIEQAMGVLQECLRLASSAGATAMHEGMHRAEGVDHEMLDQALEYATEKER